MSTTRDVQLMRTVREELDEAVFALPECDQTEKVRSGRC